MVTRAGCYRWRLRRRGRCFGGLRKGWSSAAGRVGNRSLLLLDLVATLFEERFLRADARGAVHYFQMGVGAIGVHAASFGVIVLIDCEYFVLQALNDLAVLDRIENLDTIV